MGFVILIIDVLVIDVVDHGINRMDPLWHGINLIMARNLATKLCASFTVLTGKAGNQLQLA